MADNEEDVITLISILEDKVTHDDAVKLLRSAGGDVNVAISIFFDGGLQQDSAADPRSPQNRAPSPLETAQTLHLPNDGSDDEQDAPPKPSTEPVLASPGRQPQQLEESANQPPRSSDWASSEALSHARRRPGTAPPSSGRRGPSNGPTAGPSALLLQEEVEAMQSVLGSDTDQERLRELLLLTGGNVEVALEAYFEMSDPLVGIQLDDGADGDEGPGASPGGGADPGPVPARPVPAHMLAAGGGRPQRPATASEASEGAQERRRGAAGGGGGGGGGGDQEPIRPRRPYDDLAAMLGAGVDPAVLAPIMVETKGDVAKAVELYCERLPTMPPPPKPKTAAEIAEDYYIRPDEGGVPVVCNVYDLSWGADEKDGKKKKVNSGLPGMGMGIYHSGIEIYGREISFGYSDDGSTGVFEVPGRCAAGVMPKITFKEAIVMGHIRRSKYEVDHLLNRLAAKYTGDSYDLLRRNCNHFANELCVTLVGKKIPSYINRPANVGRVAANIISVPAMAIGKLVDGVKKVKKGKDDKPGAGPNGTVVAAPSARSLMRGRSSISDEEEPAAAAAGPAASPAAGRVV